MSLYTINLLPKKESKLADSLLHFILYYFRYIVVLTQIIVIGVFFFRFREDQKIIDLKQHFRQKQQVLAVTAPIIDEAKSIEGKISYVGSVLDEQSVFTKRLNSLLALVTPDISLQGLTMSDKSIELDGTATNVYAVRSMHKRIVAIEGFEAARIATVVSKPDDIFEFSIEIPLDKYEK